MKKNNQTPQIINQVTGQPFEIPIEGSLGLLALGSQGLKAWREKKKEAGLWPPKPVEIPKAEQTEKTEK